MKLNLLIIFLSLNLYVSAQVDSTITLDSNQKNGNVIWDFECVDTLFTKNLVAHELNNSCLQEYLNGNLTQALVLIDSVIAMKLDIPKTYSNRGSIYFDLKKYNLALEDYSKAISLDSNKADFWYNRGLLHQEMNHEKLAISDYSKALFVNPKHYPSAYKLANYYAFVNQNDVKAVEIITSYLAKDSIEQKDSELYFIRGVILNRVDLSSKSIEDFNRAIKLDPSNSDYYYNRGLAHHRTNSLLNSLEDYSKAISLNPQDGRVNFNRAKVYESMRKFELAIEDYNIDLQINGPTARAYNNKGRCFMILNNFDRALENYQNALKIEPKRPLTIYNIGILYGRNGDFNKGCKYLSEAKELGYSDTKLFNQYCQN